MAPWSCVAKAGKEMVGMSPASVLLLDDSRGTSVSKMDLFIDNYT